MRRGQLLDYVATFFWALWFTLPYLLVAVATADVLAWFNQAQELYRVWSQASDAHNSHMVLTGAILLVLTYVLWLVTRDTMKCGLDPRDLERPGFGGVLRFFPAFIAALIPASAAIGLFLAARADPMVWFDEHKLRGLFDGLVPGAADLALASKLFAAGAILFWLVMMIWANTLDWGWLRRLIAYKYVPVGLVLFLILSAVIFVSPLAVPRFFGALALILLFCLCLTMFIRFFYNYSPYISAAGLLAVAAIIFIFQNRGWSDYTVEPLKLNGTVGYDQAEAAFKQWLYERKDRAKFDKQPYPVFLVAASGGGLYSARHAALTLARIQDHCPRFAQHLFAISGISGGSWGGAIFHTLARAKAKNTNDLDCELAFVERMLEPGKFEEQTKAIFQDSDFLSPLIGVGLFPNMLQLLLPTSVTALNRSAIFEKVLEESVEKHATGLETLGEESPFKGAVSGAWNASGSAGALLLNMTDADRGYQVVAAPFIVRSRRRQDENAFKLAQRMLNASGTNDYDPFNVNQDLKISSAVALSAGFPVVIGAGNLEERKKKQHQGIADVPPIGSEQRKDEIIEHRRLVDGGYYENSGVETLMQIMDQLRESEQELHVSFHVIVLDSHYPPAQTDTLFSPLKALITTRSIRAKIAITNLYTNRSLSSGYGDVWCEAAERKDELCRLRHPDSADQDCRSELDEKNRCLTHGEIALEQDGFSSRACDRLQDEKAPGANDKFGSLRPMQLSLDLQTFDVPLAFSLSRNANIVVDAFSADTLCKTGRTEGRSALLTPASENMLDRWQCGIDQLCNGMKILNPK